MRQPIINNKHWHENSKFLFFCLLLVLCSETCIATDVAVGEDKSEVDLTKPCASLHMRGINIEHSPLLFDRDDLVVCRAAKVGSTELRMIHNAYYSNERKFPRKFNSNKKKAILTKTLSSLKNFTMTNNLLHSDHFDRVMFVRHPVRRILSGWLESYAMLIDNYKGVDPSGPIAFEQWLKKLVFANHYIEDCSEFSTSMSTHMYFQHVLPPQHCRCGIWDCNVKWKTYKIEEHSVTSIMADLIPGPWIPPHKENDSRANSKKYNERDYFTSDVLEILNNITSVERELFGYDPIMFMGATEEEKDL